MLLARLLMLLVMALGCAAARAAENQPADPAPPGQNPTDFYGKESNQGVYVRDSAVALEKLALGQRMERLKEWNKSADVYQEILEKYPDRVVQSRIDQDGKICQYASVAQVVQQQLAKWPPEGLAVYNARFEPIAAAMLQKATAGDFESLHTILSLYFVTDSAKQAGLQLVELYFESGDFAAAARIGDELLTWHPTLTAERPGLLFRVSLAYHLCGDEKRSAERAGELKDKYPNATGTIAGKDVDLSRSLAQWLQTQIPTPRTAASDSWPMFMGSPDRGRISSAAGRPGARISSTALHPGKWRGISPEQIRQFQRQDEINRAAGAALGVIPSVDHGQLFFQDGARMYAVSLESGFPLPGWAQTYSGDRDGQFITGGWGVPRAQQLTVTVTDDAVLAVMGQLDRMAVMLGQVAADDRDPKLVCLDRQTGAKRWITDTRQLPEEAASLRHLSLNGSPLVVGDHVFVTARGGKGAQFEDCYILCFNLADGRYKWSCYIASASSGNMMWGGDVPLPFETCAQLTYSSGRLYVLTNLGALAAVDAYRGSIIWLSIYPRNISEDAGVRFRRFGGQSIQTYVKPWTINPLILKDGRLFAMPSDGRHVLIYDAATGMEQMRIDLEDMYNADTLVGVMGSRLVLAGERRLICLNWPNYDPVKFNAQNESMVYWLSAGIVDPIRGRPFMTADSVFACTSQKLLRFDLQSGMTVDGYPHTGRWDEDEGPGNILVTPEHVIIAGDRWVNVYTDMQLARARLDAEVAAAPDSPEPRLRYAEMLFAAGQYPPAMQKLDEAIELMGGLHQLRPGPFRDRLFNDAMTFARKLARQRDARSETLTMAEALFDRAAAAAASPSQQVQYRLSRARFTHTIRDFSAEVMLYQQILDDPALRRVSVNDDRSVTSAGDLAERAISSLIRKNGPKVYAQVEQAAAQALATVRGNNDPVAFVAIAERYPNSSAAPQALLAAADAYEAIGDPRQATHVLRMLYFKYPGYPDQFRALESMARNYLTMPDHMEVAISRLVRAVNLPGNPHLTRPLKLPDGTLLQNMSFEEAVGRLRQYADKTRPQTAALPDLHLPSPQAQPRPFEPQPPDRDISPVGSIVLQDPKSVRYDRLITWTAGSGIAIYEPGSSSPLMRCPDWTDQPAEVLWAGTRPIVYNSRAITLIDPASGRVVWKLDFSSPSPDDALDIAGLTEEGSADIQPQRIDDSALMPNNQRIIIQGNRQILLRNGRVVPLLLGQKQTPQALDAATGEIFYKVCATADRLLAVTSTGRLMAVDLATGTILWQRQMKDGRPTGPLLANDDFTVALMSDPGSASEGMGYQLLVFDTFDGRLLHQLPFKSAGGVMPLNMALSKDGMLVYTLPDRLRGKDLFEPSNFTGSSFTWETRPSTPGGQNPAGATDALFTEMRQSDQLVIDRGRVIALSDMGLFVRLYSLETGKPLAITNPQVAQLPLSTGFYYGGYTDSLEKLKLRVIGSMLYITSDDSIQAYNLDQPNQKWTGEFPDIVNLHEVIIARNEVLAVSDPDLTRNKDDTPSRAMQLLVFSRRPTPSGESGLLEFNQTLIASSNVISYQAVNGGLYYLTLDQKLHFLPGASSR